MGTGIVIVTGTVNANGHTLTILPDYRKVK